MGDIMGQKSKQKKDKGRAGSLGEKARRNVDRRKIKIDGGLPGGVRVSVEQLRHRRFGRI